METVVSHILKDEHDIEVVEKKKKKIKIQILEDEDPKKAEEEKKNEKNEKKKIKAEEKKLIRDAEDGEKFTPNSQPFGCFMIVDQRKNSEGKDWVIGVEL
jgi:superfamily II helicase